MKSILKNTWTVLDRKEKKQFTFLVVLDIFISIVDILSLAILLWIVRFYIEPGAGNNFSFLPSWLTDKDSVWLIAIFFVLFGVKNIIAYLVSRAHYTFIRGVAARITGNNLVNYQQSSFDEFVNIDSSVHIRKISFQPFEFCQYILSGIQQIITQLCLIMVAVIAILLFDARLFLLLFFILLPPVIALFYYIKNRLNTARKQIRATNERSYRYLLDALKGWVESNVYDRNRFFLDRYVTERRQFGKHLFDSISIQNMPPRIIEVFAVLGLFLLVAIAKWTGNDDSAMLITIGAFMAAAYKIIPGIVKIINASGQVRAYEFSVTDLVQHTRRPAVSNDKPIPDTISSLQLENISFEYEKQPLLHGLCFSAQKGDFIGISGKSGKGKTTILNLLLGFLSPSRGRILVNAQPADPKVLERYWPAIAYVRQQSFFIHDSILKNITLEEKDHNKERLNYAIKTSGLEEFVAKSPEGLEKIITENGKNISGGQQQRMAIARALYKRADLVLLDEPFNELDEPSVVLLLEHFKELADSGKIVIMITHDKKSLAYCNKIISLDEKE